MMAEYSDLCRRMIIALHETPGVGWHSINRAVEHQLWNKARCQVQDLLSIGLLPQQAKAVAAVFADQRWIHDETHAHTMKSAGAVALTAIEPGYPKRLKEIDQAPWVLYARGRLELLKRPSIAIVGTRVPTAYGRHAASALAEQLSHKGLTVVSGLAKGIDRYAHESALLGRGSTIAVLATPIDRCYPLDNLAVYRSIADNGLLLSETPFGTKLHPGQFPLRNRIIAGLSVGTLVVEGAVRSGSLITVEHAYKMSREVFAVPGPIHSPKSEGPNGLIKRGEAKLVSCAQDIMEELGWLQSEIQAASERSHLSEDNVHSVVEDLEPEEARLLNYLREEPMSAHELHERSSIPFGHLSVLLLNLCIKRKIELQPGSIYTVISM